MAQLEAASVTAFTLLAEELSEHQAPEALLSAARLAASDEVRHADQMSELARRLGAAPGAVTVAERRSRPLVELAIENAVEGCVNEAFGAVLMRWQALRAGDPGTREMFAGIARDEAEHAALAFEVHAWVTARLSAAERGAVAAAARDAISDLARATDDPSDAVEVLGLPSARARDRLLESLERRLWTSTGLA
jgi:rubrerythrin